MANHGWLWVIEVVLFLCGCDSDDKWLNEHEVTFFVLLLGKNTIILSYVSVTPGLTHTTPATSVSFNVWRSDNTLLGYSALREEKHVLLLLVVF